MKQTKVDLSSDDYETEDEETELREAVQAAKALLNKEINKEVEVIDLLSDSDSSSFNIEINEINQQSLPLPSSMPIITASILPPSQSKSFNINQQSTHLNMAMASSMQPLPPPPPPLPEIPTFMSTQDMLSFSPFHHNIVNNNREMISAIPKAIHLNKPPPLPPGPPSNHNMFPWEHEFNNPNHGYVTFQPLQNTILPTPPGLRPNSFMLHGNEIMAPNLFVGSGSRPNLGMAPLPPTNNYGYDISNAMMPVVMPGGKDDRIRHQNTSFNKEINMNRNNIDREKDRENVCVRTSDALNSGAALESRKRNMTRRSEKKNNEQKSNDTIETSKKDLLYDSDGDLIMQDNNEDLNKKGKVIIILEIYFLIQTKNRKLEAKIIV